MRLQHRFGRRSLACDLTLVLSGDGNQHQPQLQLQCHPLLLHSFNHWAIEVEAAKLRATASHVPMH